MTAMGKIIRFSLANIKKHKFEAVSLTLLVMMCMLLIGCAHIGEVQSSIWDEETVRVCAENNVPLL